VIAARLTSGWLPGERISSDGTDSVGGSLATRSDGSAVALWHAYDFATNDEGMYAALLGDPPPSPEPPPPPPATPPAAPEAPAPPPVTPAASQADSPPPVLPVAPGSDAIPAPFSCTLPRRPSALALPTGLSQLRINQSISVASIRRLNAIAARLDGRPAPRPRSGPRGTIRATTGQLRINQRIAEAGYTRARAIYQRLGGTGAPAVRSRARTIELNRAGVGLNQLTNIRALDMLNCITRNLS
jgi:hypothetical protein